jgi:hypothetical protein
VFPSRSRITGAFHYLLFSIGKLAPPPRRYFSNHAPGTIDAAAEQAPGIRCRHARYPSGGVDRNALVAADHPGRIDLSD